MNSALQGRRILFAVPPSRFDEAQLYQTWQILAECGAWLVLGSDSSTGVVVGENGAVARVSRALHEADPSKFDAMIFVAGEWDGLAKPVASRFRKAGVTIAAFKGVPVKADVVGSVERLSRFLAELEVAVGKRTPVAANAPVHA